jgi:hypothetical protein
LAAVDNWAVVADNQAVLGSLGPGHPAPEDQ